MSTKIKIGGVPYVIDRVEDRNKICHNDNKEINPDLLGQISHSKQSIRILKSSPERELRITLHEILHGVVDEYYIRELTDTDGDHIEFAIIQLALGLAEALESVGITKIVD